MGLEDVMGHVDFYPNGGEHQPGCTIGGDWLDLLVGKYWVLLFLHPTDLRINIPAYVHLPSSDQYFFCSLVLNFHLVFI